VSETVNVAKLSPAIENLLRPLAGQAKLLGERSKKLDDLGNVVVVLAVLGARLRIEEVVAGYEFKDLQPSASEVACNLSGHLPSQPCSKHQCSHPTLIQE
jgi:hypothetical protein